MEIKIIGEHLVITEAMAQYINDKFSHIPVPEKLDHVEFRIGSKKDDQHVHFLARCLHEDIVVKCSGNNIYATIDQIMDKIKRSFLKTKERKNIHMYKLA